jgi:hypothetical protein
VVADGEPITPEMRLHIEAETQQCLTRPYDRELLDCVLVTRQARTCLNDFRRRKGRPSEPSAWP